MFDYNLEFVKLQLLENKKRVKSRMAYLRGFFLLDTNRNNVGHFDQKKRSKMAEKNQKYMGYKCSV